MAEEFVRTVGGKLETVRNTELVALGNVVVKLRERDE